MRFFLFYGPPVGSAISCSGGMPNSSRVPAVARKGRGEASGGKGSTISCCSTTVPCSVTSSRCSARQIRSPSKLEKVRVSRGEVP